jgi:hypothetical protein
MELNNNFKYVKEQNIIKYYWKCKGDDPIVRGKYLPYICSHIHHGPAFYLRFSGLKGHWHEILRLYFSHLSTSPAPFESYPIAFQIFRNCWLFDECSTHLQRNLAILRCGLQRRIRFSPWNPSRNKNPLCGPQRGRWFCAPALSARSPSKLNDSTNLKPYVPNDFKLDNKVGSYYVETKIRS